MATEWTLLDWTCPKGGYLQLQRNGVRVCDFFPFAAHADEAWVRQQAEAICHQMNEATLPTLCTALRESEPRQADDPI